MAKKAKTSSALVAVVGTGVIGASWAACFLAKGFDVVATDPAEGAEARLRSLVSDFWPALERIGFAPDASPARLKFDSDLTSTVAEAVFIQENGPERVDIKRDLIARIDAAAPANTLIATSSSGIADQRNPAGRGTQSRTCAARPSIHPAAPDSPGRSRGRTCDLGESD